MSIDRVLITVLAALVLSGCVVTETWDIGSPRLRTGSRDLARGRTTVEELLDQMGIPFAIGQGEEEGVQAYLYVDLRKRQKSILIPPVIPVYAQTRVTEKKRAMMVILKDRRVVEYLVLSIEDVAKQKQYGFGDEDARLLFALLGG